MKAILRAMIVIGAALGSLLAADQNVAYKVHGQGWVDFGRLVKSSDTLANDGTDNPRSSHLSGNSMQSMGAQFTILADLSENFEGAFGFGTYKATNTLGTTNDVSDPRFLVISLFKNYIAQARLTYYKGEKSAPWLSVTVGNFSYDYNPDVKNLGLYLLRGPVYPGILIGGFEDFSADTTKSNVMGAKIHHAMGDFSQDLIFKNEYDLPPTFDWSLAYVAKYKLFGGLELGAGANLYRLVPYNSKLERPGHLGSLVDGVGSIDTTGSNGDSTKWVYYTHQGTKLMSMFSADLNHWLGIGSMGPNDMKLYGEAAILGITNYGTYYNKISQRIPVMLGFNVPTFGWLDFLSVEGEWYGSPYRNDLVNIGNLNGVGDWMTITHPTPSPVPAKGIYPDSTRDNFKWSVFAEKSVKNHIRFTAQIADDHFRPRPIATGLINAAGGTAEAFTTPHDWYFMFRMGYFF